jgi:hypothetical protein
MSGFQPARHGRHPGTCILFEVLDGERADVGGADEDRPIADSPANRPKTPDSNPNVNVMNCRIYMV